MHLIIIHINVALDVIAATNLVEFGIGKGILLDEEQQLVDFLLLVKEVHVSRLSRNMHRVGHA